MKSTGRLLIWALLFTFVSLNVVAQQQQSEEEAYTQVITARADKIVQKLGINDSTQYLKVRAIITDQYRAINDHHEALDASVKAAKKNGADEEKIEKLKVKADKQMDKIHDRYVSALSKNLTDGQVEQVKDGMTYSVFPNTYKAYQEMLPNLTQEQKDTIYNYLKIARERAMDAPSSDKKHAWFGKYKGKINNYMSAQGIDMNKASKEWQARIKAAKGQ